MVVITNIMMGYKMGLIRYIASRNVKTEHYYYYYYYPCYHLYARYL
jgi:hypothetical protein